MLEHLVGVDHVERVVGEVQGVDIGHGELDVFQASFGRRVGCLAEDLPGGVDGRHTTRSDEGGQVRGDGAGPAADVQHAHAGAEFTDEVGRGIGGGAPAVRAQHRLVVAVGVDGGLLRHDRASSLEREPRNASRKALIGTATVCPDAE